MSAAVAQSAVLSLRDLFEDVAAWGWVEAPTRRLIFAAGIPKLDRALPRALSPDVDEALMAAFRSLDDPFDWRSHGVAWVDGSAASWQP